MPFSPVSASRSIVDKYCRYLKTSFRIGEPYSREFDELLSSNESFAKGPYLEVTDAFEKGNSINQLISEGILPKTFVKIKMNPDRPLYKHQENAIRKIAVEGRNLVVSTGTGSGKTESFLIPVLRELVMESEAGTLTPGVRALLIYPMNALANDQTERLRSILADFPNITFGVYTGQTEQKRESALKKYKKLNNNQEPKKNELISRDEMIDTPPNILVTNYAMLEYLMIRPKDSVFFTGKYAGSWKFIVFDEAHVYHGSTGIEVSMLFSRLKTLLNNQKINYILTSATLGDKEDNNAVAEFAKKLCSAEFSETDIVRAERIIPTTQHETIKKDISFYEKIAAQINDNLSDSDILTSLGENPNADLASVLYDSILHDSNYWHIRQILERPETVKTVSEKMGWSEKQVADFVSVASKAELNGGKLFDARYHMFLRATDSAFVTLAPNNRIMIDRANMVYSESDDKYYKVFEAATCSTCGSVYLVGKIANRNRLEQYNVSDDIEDKELFLLANSVNDTDSDHTLNEEGVNAHPYEICPHCGFLRKVGSREQCEHGTDDYQKVFRVNLTNDSHTLTKCLRCENVNNTGILRMFFSGQEASTSVIGTALFEELPSYKITVTQPQQQVNDSHSKYGFGKNNTSVSKKEKVAKQFIAFSDSRQAAAFYASYLNTTYNNILYKRMITETFSHMNEEGLSVPAMEDMLEGEFRKYGVTGKLTFQNDEAYNLKKEAWKAILGELADNNGSTSLTHFGMLGIYNIISEGWPNDGWEALGISGAELQDLVSVFVTSLLADGAIYFDINLTKDDLSDITHGGVLHSYTLSDSSKRLNKSFIPTRSGMTNKRVEYLQKIIIKKGNELSNDEASDALMELWNLLINQSVGIMKCVTNNEYRVDVNKIQLRKPSKWYLCNKCHRVICHNIENVCPTYHCDGELSPVVPAEYFKNNHYYEIYNNLEMRDLRVVEHTAQLDQETAFDYQNKFKNKEIDVLSCSTTFEMGVDVGSLETVFMRNMPPMPANYAQRAGRAGRSSQSAAFALTFCNKSSHDFSYFKAPVGMIKGKIVPPNYNVENDKIAIRHLFASTLSFFWKIHPEYFSTIGYFCDKDNVGKNGMNYLREYLESKPDNLRQFLKGFLPSRLSDLYGVDSFKWIDMLIGEDGVLTKAVETYKYEVDLLNKAFEEACAGKKANLIKWLSERITAYSGENILTFFSRKNVLPKYGFPVDTVEMTVWDKNIDGKLGLELSRDLSMAISEYAPDSQIIANNKLITSRYIRKIPNIGWKMYSYVRCENCKTLNIQPYIEKGNSEIPIAECCQCHQSFEHNRPLVFIVPEQGFIANKVEKPGLKKPERTYRGEMSYVGTGVGATVNTYSIKDAIVEVINSQNDEMAVLNTTPFYVCSSCGYAEVDSESQFVSTKEKLHSTSSDHPCRNNILRRYSLGYRYLTDVARIRFVNYEINDFNVAMSVLYAVLKSACYCLNIEENDISGCLQSNFTEGRLTYSLVLFDNTPGGAGHTKRLNDKDILTHIFAYALESMKNCSCGGSIGDTSCYSCLRSYKNQKYHDILQRRYAIDFLSKIVE